MLRRFILLFLVTIPLLVCAGEENWRSPGRRQNRDMAIVVDFPEKPILIPQYRSFWNFWTHVFDFNRDQFVMVGHTGVMLVNGTSGDLAYYDFGRYDDRNDLVGPRPEYYGTVRSARHVPQLELKLKARLENGWITNLDTILLHLGSNKLFRSYGRIEAAVVYDLDLSRMLARARGFEERVHMYYGAPVHQYCTRFVRDVIRAGGGSFSILSFTGKQTVRDVRRKWPTDFY